MSHFVLLQLHFCYLYKEFKSSSLLISHARTPLRILYINPPLILFLIATRPEETTIPKSRFSCRCLPTSSSTSSSVCGVERGHRFKDHNILFNNVSPLPSPTKSRLQPLSMWGRVKNHHRGVWRLINNPFVSLSISSGFLTIMSLGRSPSPSLYLSSQQPLLVDGRG